MSGMVQFYSLPHVLFPSKYIVMFFKCIAAANGAAALRGRQQRSQGTAGGTFCSANAGVCDAGETAARGRAAGPEGYKPLFSIYFGEHGLNGQTQRGMSGSDTGGQHADLHVCGSRLYGSCLGKSIFFFYLVPSDHS